MLARTAAAAGVFYELEQNVDVHVMQVTHVVRHVSTRQTTTTMSDDDEVIENPTPMSAMSPCQSTTHVLETSVPTSVRR